MKKLISVILAVILAFSAFSVIAYAEEAEELFVYEINEEGYAVLVHCDPSVEGAVVIPAVTEIDGELYEVKVIGEYAFENCVLITSISLSDGIEQVDEMAFLNCTALKDFYAPESLAFCAYTAFYGTLGVTVHCYSSNVQLLTVFAVIRDIKIDVLDGEGDNLDIGLGGNMGTIASIDLTNTIVLAVKRIIQMILYFLINYGVDDEIEDETVQDDLDTTTPAIKFPITIL